MSEGAAPLGVSLVLAVLNEERMLPRVLEAIQRQRFPRERLEVVVADGGSTDATRDVARRFGARVVDNPLRRAEPGGKAGIRAASNPIRIVLAADHGFPSQDWIARIAAVFERTDVRGVYTHVEPAPEDPPFCRYFNLMHADPFNWFVYGPPSPREFGSRYPVLERGDDHVVYDLRRGERPLLALTQGFALRGELPENPEHEEDDILPVWEMIERGERFAYCDVGIYHHTLAGFGDFLAKYRRRAVVALTFEGAPYRDRQALLSRRRRLRRWLWIPYALSVVAPLADALRGLARDREAVWLYHPAACLALSATMAVAVVEARAARRRG